MYKTDIDFLRNESATYLRNNRMGYNENGKLYIKDTNGVVHEIGGGNDALIETNYADLLTKITNKKLIPGAQYRITNYQCTTTQENTLSVNHLFDIIVIADSNETLNENARAIKHVGDTYFANCNLDAWELKYCVTNDTTRFAWADSTNGKGVIYYMKDEYNNECPYDFKNILFKRWKVDAVKAYGQQNGSYNWYDYSVLYPDQTHALVGTYSAPGYNTQDNLVTNSKDDFVWCYTFDIKYGGNHTDRSVVQINGCLCKDNIIKESSIFDGLKIHLNNIIFLNTKESEYDCYSNHFGVLCRNMTFGNSCYSNSFGNNCTFNIFGNDCKCNNFGDACYYNSFGNGYCYNSFGNEFCNNSFGNDCYYNSFGNACNYNSFGNDCYYNSFGNACNYNSFGNNCGNNSFGNECYNNSFGNECYDNSFGNECFANNFAVYCCFNIFGNECGGNSFGNECLSNSFGNSCTANKFVNDCYSNSFGNNCSANNFGDYCSSNIFGNNCAYITFGVLNVATYSYYRYITIASGCSYIVLRSSTTRSASQYYQNIVIGAGVSGTSTNYKTIIDSNVGQTYETKYVPDNSKTVVI